MRARGEPRLASAWPALREVLLRVLVRRHEDADGLRGPAITELGHLRQTSGGGRRTGKGELADAIDGLFNDLDADAQDRVTANLISDLLRGTRTTTTSGSSNSWSAPAGRLMGQSPYR